MSLTVKHLYKFGKFVLDTNEKHLLSENNRIQLTPKVFELLHLFLENSGKLITKDEILDKVWSDSFVEEGNLTFTVNQLRKLLSDNARKPNFIETIPRRGYRFIAEVEKTSTQAIEISETLVAAVANETVEIALAEPPPKTRKYSALSLGTFIVLAILLSGFVYRQSFSREILEYKNFEIERITNDGNSVISAISPDGNYVVYVKETNGTQGLFVRQTAESRDIEVINPQTFKYWGLTVSPDSQRIFYTAWEANKSDASLFQVPILGGTPQKVLDMIDSSVSFSPVGNKMAYVRTVNTAKRSELVTANSDGTDIQVLAVKNSPETFDVSNGSPAWSPDGKEIVAAVVSTNLGEKCQLVVFDVITKESKPLTEKQWTSIEQVAWLPNQNGLVMNAGETSHEWKQIWFVSYPDGEARKITNDLSDYIGVKLSNDGKTIVSVQREQLTHHIVSASTDIMNGKIVLSETGKNAVNEGVAWSPDEKLVLRYSQNNEDSIWQVDPDGENKKQLTKTDDVEPSVSADGKTIIFSSRHNGIYRLWRIDPDGGNRKLLTNEQEEAELFSNCSSVENVCVYQRGWKKALIYKVSLETGEISPVIKESQAIRPAISPDGKNVAYFGLSAQDEWFLAIAKLENGEVIRKFPIARTVVSRYVRWTPDGNNLAYIDTEDKISNIIFQPIDGGTLQPITDFKTEEIFYFDWSRDGKQFAFSHGTLINNVVAIRDIN